MRAQAAGHDVRWYVPPDERQSLIGNGIVKRVDDPWDWYKWSDMILYTYNTVWMHAVDAFKAKGWPVVAATPESASWELDRSKGQHIFKQCGVKILPEKEFSDYDSAIAFVKKTMKRYVSKPSGNEENKALSYVSKTPADMVYMLERWKRAKKRMRFILQEFTPGTEMAVGGWFGPGGFAPGWCENFEFKKMFNGDLGPNVGEQGTVLRSVAKSKLADMVLKPCEQMLSKTGHIGYVDVNCIIAEDGTPYPLEFTMRKGWPCFNIQQAIQIGDPADWLLDLALGGKPKAFKEGPIAAGIVVSIGDFPFSHMTKKEVVGIPIYHYKENAENIHPCQLMNGEAPNEVNGVIKPEKMLVTAGDYVLVCTGTGDSVSEATRHAYKVTKSIEMPMSPGYRTDIGVRLKKQLPVIQAQGFAKGISY